MIRLRLLLGCLSVLALMACASTAQRDDDVDGEGASRQGKAAGSTGKSGPPMSPQDAAADEAISLAGKYYDQGDYPAVIGILTVNRELPLASVPLQVRAKKLLAFSHCIAGRAAACEKCFQEILELDPLFDLSPYEAGNPLWDPAFRRAKRSTQKKRGG